jgi:hypothetical protein
MKKVKVNFWMDTVIFINFIGVIFTGVLLHRFPPELKENLILGVSRYDWGDLHWVLALSLIFLTIVHLFLHWGWLKGTFKKYLKLNPKTVITVAILVIILFGTFFPVYLTRDFPHRREFKGTYPNTGFLGIEKEDSLSKI